MSTPSDQPPASTPDPTRANAQSRVASVPQPNVAVPEPQVPEEPFELSEGVTRPALVTPYERRDDDPLYRPLKIFALDPATSKLEGSIALVNVPYEKVVTRRIRNGEGGWRSQLTGSLLRIEELPGEPDVRADLNDRKLLIMNGLDPSPSNRAFHHQMLYAVCSTVYAAFRTALGRPVAWGFDGTLRVRKAGEWQLVIFPHDREAGKNAYYDHWKGELHFGYYRGDRTQSTDLLPAGLYYTCLSHDIVVHEMTHALLDGLRARLTMPTHPDVPAFHEAFSDLVAIFQHFSYDKVVRAALVRSGGDLRRATLLTDLATEFGHTTGHGGPLRSAIDTVPGAASPRLYNADEDDPHALGSVLVSAVFEAFDTVFRRKTQRYFELAQGGAGPGARIELSPVLVDILSEEASHLASQFLAMCIRAIDYCPPVDVRFGEYLRAMITADHDLVPDDRWAYREALIDAFRRRSIFPEFVDHLSEDALLWRKPQTHIDDIAELNFAALKFRGDPQHPAGAEELVRQACALGRVVTTPALMREFGLLDPEQARRKNLEVDKPCIESIRSSRRAGPQGQIVFDLVAEVTQRMVVHDHELGAWDFYGGATVILGPRGEVRYVIRKRIDQHDRLRRQRDFMSSSMGRRFWSSEAGAMRVSRALFQILHTSSA
jgi:hypothetical protein